MISRKAAAAAANAGTGATLVIVGLTSLPVAFALAYRFENGFLLVLAILGVFHWLGSWHSMIGRSTYAFDIQVEQQLHRTAVSGN